MRRLLFVSVSGYWLNRKPSAREERNSQLTEKIKAILTIKNRAPVRFGLPNDENSS